MRISDWSSDVCSFRSIFLNAAGGSIATGGAMTLTTDSPVGVQSQGAGGVGAGADLTISAGDEIDLRPEARTGTAPTIPADGALRAHAAHGRRGGGGSPVHRGGPLSLSPPTGRPAARPEGQEGASQ